MRWLCDGGKDNEEAGKDGADEEEVNDDEEGNEVQTELDDIVTWHGLSLRARIIMQTTSLEFTLLQ